MSGGQFRAKYVWARSQRGVELTALRREAAENPAILLQSKSTLSGQVRVEMLA